MYSGLWTSFTCVFFCLFVSRLFVFSAKIPQWSPSLGAYCTAHVVAPLSSKRNCVCILDNIGSLPSRAMSRVACSSIWNLWLNFSSVRSHSRTTSRISGQAFSLHGHPPSAQIHASEASVHTEPFPIKRPTRSTKFSSWRGGAQSDRAHAPTGPVAHLFSKKWKRGALCPPRAIPGRRCVDNVDTCHHIPGSGLRVATWNSHGFVWVLLPRAKSGGRINRTLSTGSQRGTMFLCLQETDVRILN